jgi:hypothetical protein
VDLTPEQLRAGALLAAADAPEGWTSEGQQEAASPGETMAGVGIGPPLAECTGAPAAAFAIDEVGPSFTSPDSTFGVISAVAIDPSAADHIGVLRERQTLQCLADVLGGGVTVSAVTPTATTSGVATAGWVTESPSTEDPRVSLFDETVVVQRGEVRVALKLISVGQRFPTDVRDQLVDVVVERLSTLLA